MFLEDFKLMILEFFILLKLELLDKNELFNIVFCLLLFSSIDYKLLLF